MKVGVLTGGGDAPGLNAAICGLGRRLAERRCLVLGFRDGWRGLLEDDAFELDASIYDHLVTTGGTVLGASSANPYRNPERDVPKVLQTFRNRQTPVSGCPRSRSASFRGPVEHSGCRD